MTRVVEVYARCSRIHHHDVQLLPRKPRLAFSIRRFKAATEYWMDTDLWSRRR
jgi:hypothetical protein